jgi:hypothetical protein
MSSPSQCAEVRPIQPGAHRPNETSTDSEAPAKTTLGRIHGRNSWMGINDPDAARLEAEILDAIGPTLDGWAGHFAPNGHPEHGCAAVRGDMYLSLAYLCRLRESRRPEARKALETILALLAYETSADARAVLVAASDYVKESGEALSAAISGKPDAIQQAIEAVESGNALLKALLADREARR